MKPVFLIGAAVIAVLGVAAIAYAASGNDDNDTAQGNHLPATETPLPVEPDGGIGTTPDQPVTDQPIPSEPPFTVTPAAPQPSLPAGRYAEAAPIDQLDLRIAESFPPQYFLYVLAGLPSGCAEQYTHSVERNGNVISVEVLNSFPEGNPACTAIYGMYELNIALGSDFVPGQTYTVSVNDGAAETTFVAQ